MSHTPPPWYADSFGNVTTHPPRTGLRMLLPTTGIIAKVYKNEEVNTPLIAAAPKMLAALRGVAAWLTEADNDPLALEVRAAIAEAEGR